MKIPIKNQWSYDHIPRNRDLRLVIPNSCNSPSRTLLIDWQGECFVCGCEAWLPISVGCITDFSTLEEIWQSPVARQLQHDIDQGTFDNCAVTRCGVLTDTNMVKQEYTISINIDESCNLWCPSCRKEKIMITSGPEYDNKLSATNHLVDLLQKFDKPARIIMSGNGDPLASSIMRPLLHRFQPRPGQWIKLFTNGLLLRKQLDQNPILNHIDEYLISIDAGSAKVYEQVRLGGRWQQLLDNFQFLQANARSGAQVSLAFVIQKNNYQDIVNFCQTVIDHGFQGTITKLEDWGTWSNFNEHDVLNTVHPEHAQALHHLRTCINLFSQHLDHSIFFAPAVKDYVKS